MVLSRWALGWSMTSWSTVLKNFVLVPITEIVDVSIGNRFLCCHLIYWHWRRLNDFDIWLVWLSVTRIKWRDSCEMDTDVNALTVGRYIPSWKNADRNTEITSQWLENSILMSCEISLKNKPTFKGTITIKQILTFTSLISLTYTVLQNQQFSVFLGICSVYTKLSRYRRLLTPLTGWKKQQNQNLIQFECPSVATEGQIEKKRNTDSLVLAML